MEKKRPQLELDELRQFKWLLGGALSLIAISSLLYLELNAWLFLAAGCILVPAVILRPAWPARVPLLVHRLVFPVIVAYSSYDFYAHGEPLASLVHLDVLLLLYRSCHYRKRRDDLQLIVLGLFLIVMAGVLTVSLAFAVQIVVFVACGLLLLFVVTLIEAQEGTDAGAARLNVVPAWTGRSWPELFHRIRATCDWRALALGGGLFVGFVALSGVLFMAIPRFQLDSGLALDRLLPKKSYTGFSDVLKYDEFTDIAQDDSVVLRVEASERELVPAVLYWRMVVLDEYKNGAFQMSKAMKDAVFYRELTSTHVESFEAPSPGRPAYWTFYLEPGAGRYLALAGGFRRLTFTEPQAFRASLALRLVMLSRDPVAMKAYRVEGMNTGERMEGFMPANAPKMDATGLNLSDNDRLGLQKIVSEIRGESLMSAEGFARAAMIWLAKQHKYALKSNLPPGTNDPLVRWLASNEPGHCELFAGAFTLLARTAGYPTRVVAGFMGGMWNDDYLIVRNSDAHAWCEIQVGRGQWLRVDPTNEGPRLLGGAPSGVGAMANLRTVPRGWAARLDRLRLLWYRRIVNFDRAEQLQLLQSIKQSAEKTGRWIQEWTGQVAASLKHWIMQPWNFGRGSRLLSLGLLAGLAGFGLWHYGRSWWAKLRWARGKAMDPVRREAGNWLRCMDRVKGMREAPVVRADLERLRYGRRETWTEPAKIFREAKRVCRSRK